MCARVSPACVPGQKNILFFKRRSTAKDRPAWMKTFMKDGNFKVPANTYDKRQPHDAFIDDEDIRAQCRELLDDRLPPRK